LEARAFGHAAATIALTELDELAGDLDAMIAASHAGDVEAVTELDLRFHGRVIDAAGFRYLRRLWRSVDSLVRWRTRQSQELVGITDRRDLAAWLIGPTLGHGPLLDALRARDPIAAADAARRHVLEALGRLEAEGR
jgi:DNA-binding GntR family transcriptional regulator